MADRLVCNIYFYVYTRFFFSLYHEFECSKPVQWLARWYCLFVCANLIAWLYNIFSFDYPLLPIILSTSEYLLYVLISFWKNNKYLLRYYKKRPLIDDERTDAYRPMRLYLLGYTIVLIVSKFISFIRFLILHGLFDRDTQIYACLELILWCSNLVGRLPTLFVFSLLYIRVTTMRKMLESNDFQCRRQGKHHPRQYIQMYEAILDGLEKTDDPVKLQLLVSAVFSTLFVSFETLYNLYLMKSPSVIESVFDMIWFATEIVMRFSPFLVSAILSDMVYLELRKMLVITLKRRIDCKNERDRGEIQQLVQLLKDHPFQYSLWRTVPLNLRCVVSSLSFCITSIIAILQIKSWYK